MLSKFIKNIFRKFIGYFLINDYPYRIEEIDGNGDQVVQHCLNAHTIIKTTQLDIIGDEQILDGLSSIQACYLGYYYGKSQRETMRLNKIDVNKEKKKINFLLRFKRGRFKIVSIDRYNNLTYIDVKNNRIYTEKPLEIAKNNYVINNIDPSQACYIGILAGIEVATKGLSTTKFNVSCAHLKIVK